MGKTEKTVAENEVSVNDGIENTTNVVTDEIVNENPFPDNGKRSVSEVKETNFSGREAYVVTFDDSSDHIVTKDVFEAIAGFLKKEDK